MTDYVATNTIRVNLSDSTLAPVVGGHQEEKRYLLLAYVASVTIIPTEV